MDCLSRSLFDEFNDESPKKAKFQRPCTPPVINTTNKLPLPFITEENGCVRDRFKNDDFNSSGEMISPPCSPAKMMSPSPNRLLQSPPSIHRGFLALKLFDTPHTPKTLLSKFKDAANDNLMDKEKDNKDLKRNKRFNSKSKDRFAELRETEFKPPTFNPSYNKKQIVYANINPFTPSPSVVKHKRTRQEFERYKNIIFPCFVLLCSSKSKEDYVQNSSEYTVSFNVDRKCNFKESLTFFLNFS